MCSQRYGLRYEEFAVATFRDVELLFREWARARDYETARLRGLAAAILSPYMRDADRISIAEALPFLEPEAAVDEATSADIFDLAIDDLRDQVRRTHGG